MPCYNLHDKAGKRIGHICGKLGKPCTECGGISGFACDYPVGKGKTCDRSLCERHAREIGPNLHYCGVHQAAWDKFRNAGGVTAVLQDVLPFKGH